MSKVVLQGYIEVPNDQVVMVKTELARHIELTKKEVGCIVFNVEQDNENQCRFNVYEEFVNEAAFSAHQERVKSSHWGTASKDVKRHYSVKRV